MHQSPNEQKSEPGSPDIEQPDGKIVRLMPRQRPATEHRPEPLKTEDDDDPGPSAA